MKNKVNEIKECVVILLATYADRLRDSSAKFLYSFINSIYEYLFHVKAFGVINHKEYSQNSSTTLYSRLYSNRIGYTSNLIYNDSEEKQRLIPISMNDVFLYHYKELVICGDSDLIIDDAKNLLINDLCFNKSSRLKYHDSIMLSQFRNTALVRYRCKRISVESGIVISGLFSNNYYHTLYDNLIRIIAIEKDCIPEDVPYLIDHATFKIPSLHRVFDCLTKERKRKIIILNPRTPYHVKNLYYVTHVNHIIPSIVTYSQCRPEDIVFDIELTLKMRDLLLSVQSDKTFPEKIFISRKNTTRRNFNEEEVYSILIDEGFEMVAPENMSFEEQVALFNKAKIIVGGGGAAMTNLMFCDKTCKVLIISKTIEQVPCFTTIPYALGVTVRYYGQYNADNRLHSDYYVNPEGVRNCLRKLMTKSDE